MSSQSKRFPRGYTSQHHETLGSDILAVLRAVTVPQVTLGREKAAELAALDPSAWYPTEMLITLTDNIAASLGERSLPRIGRQIFALSHEERVKTMAHSARDILYGFDAIYHHANRGGEIGKWEVLVFTPGHAEVEKTTPHHCVMEEGIVERALLAVGAPSKISQRQCFRKGADSCIFVIDSPVRGERWG